MGVAWGIRYDGFPDLLCSVRSLHPLSHMGDARSPTSARGRASRYLGRWASSAAWFDYDTTDGLTS